MGCVLLGAAPAKADDKPDAAGPAKVNLPQDRHLRRKAKRLWLA